MLKNLKERVTSIKKSFNFLSNKNLLGGASFLISGTIAGQALILITAPFITRLFTPDELGILAIFGAILTILGSISTFRYEISIPQPKNDIDATALLSLAIIINFIFTILITFFVYLFGETILSLLNANEINNYLWTIPIGVCIAGLVKIYTYWALRKEMFSTVALTRFQQGGGMAFSQVFFGFLNLSSFGLIIGYLIGLGAGLSRLIYFWSKNGAKKVKGISISLINKMGKRYKDLPLFSTWGGLINVLGLQLPIILFASLFSPYLVGFYLLAHRVANAPVQLVAESIGKVFYISSIKELRAKKLDELVLKVFRLLLRISLLPFFILTIIAPEFFFIVFGSDWLEAGIYLQYMIIWLASSFIFVPLMTLFAALEKHKFDLIFQIFLVLVRAAGIYIGSVLGGPIMAIALFSILSALVYILFGMWLIKLSGINYITQIKVFSIEFATPFSIALIFYLIKDWLLADQILSISNPLIYLIFALALVLVIFSLYNSRSLFLIIQKYSN